MAAKNAQLGANRMAQSACPAWLVDFQSCLVRQNARRALWASFRTKLAQGGVPSACLELAQVVKDCLHAGPASLEHLQLHLVLQIASCVPQGMLSTKNLLQNAVHVLLAGIVCGVLRLVQLVLSAHIKIYLTKLVVENVLMGQSVHVKA